MPTINLRNPFRRDGARPPLRQRAASLKAAAARAIRGEAPSLGAVDPALARLEAEFRAAAADYYAADTAIGVVHETYEEPPMPADLRVSRLDWIEHTIPRADTAPAPGGRLRFLPYGRLQVEELRGRRHMMSVPGLGDQRPNPRAQARGDAIVAAWDAWQAEIAASKEAVGLPALLDARYAAVERRDKALARIHETPARPPARSPTSSSRPASRRRCAMGCRCAPRTGTCCPMMTRPCPSPSRPTCSPSPAPRCRPEPDR